MHLGLIHDSFPKELEDLSEISSISFSLVGTFLHFYGYSIKIMIHRLYSWKCNWKKKQTKLQIISKNIRCHINTSILLLIIQSKGKAPGAGSCSRGSAATLWGGSRTGQQFLWIPALLRTRAQGPGPELQSNSKSLFIFKGVCGGRTRVRAGWTDNINRRCPTKGNSF